MDRSPEIYLRKVLEGWHFDEPIGQIYRENFGQWAAWAFWNKDLAELLHERNRILKEQVAQMQEELTALLPVLADSKQKTDELMEVIKQKLPGVKQMQETVGAEARTCTRRFCATQH